MACRTTHTRFASVAAQTLSTSLDFQAPLRCPSFLLGALLRNTGEWVRGADFVLFYSFHLSLSPLFYLDQYNLYNEFGVW